METISDRADSPILRREITKRQNKKILLIENGFGNQVFLLGEKGRCWGYKNIRSVFKFRTLKFDMPRKPRVAPDYLAYLYWHKKKSLMQISRMVGISDTAVLHHLRKFNKSLRHDICTQKIHIQKRNKKLAEFIGIMLGDGGIFVNRDVSQVTVTSNFETEERYLTEHVTALTKELFRVRVRWYKQKDSKAFRLKLNSVKLIKFLLESGLVAGNKVKNNVGIPGWIKLNLYLLRACLRGLFDTDGSVFRMSQRDSDLPRISFVNNSKRLLEDVRSGLIGLGFSPSKMIRS